MQDSSGDFGQLMLGAVVASERDPGIPGGPDSVSEAILALDLHAVAVAIKLRLHGLVIEPPDRRGPQAQHLPLLGCQVGGIPLRPLLYPLGREPGRTAPAGKGGRP